MNTIKIKNIKTTIFSKKFCFDNDLFVEKISY